MNKKFIKVSRQKIEEVTSLVKKLQTLTGKKIVFKEDISDYRSETNEPEFDDEDFSDEWDPVLNNEDEDQIGNEYHNPNSEEDFDEFDDFEIDQPNSPLLNPRFRDDY